MLNGGLDLSQLGDQLVDSFDKVEWGVTGGYLWLGEVTGHFNNGDTQHEHCLFVSTDEEGVVTVEIKSQVAELEAMPSAHLVKPTNEELVFLIHLRRLLVLVHMDKSKEEINHV